MDLRDQISLDHVRLRGVQAEAGLARLRLSHLLSNAGLRPPSMSPSAILVIRSMPDPSPGRITTDFSSAAIASAEWQTAAQNRLDDLYAGAARPAWGPVSSTAKSVLFADYGEMLACLAIDLSSGSAGAWWWRHFLKRHGQLLPGSWASIWEEHLQYVPSALQHLSVRGRACAVIERVAPAQAWRLLIGLSKTFELPGAMFARTNPPVSPPIVIAESRPLPGEPSEAARSDSDPDRQRQQAEIVRKRTTLPPWEPHVPSAKTPASLGMERRALLGVGLLLRSAPAVALSTAFGAHFQSWLQANGESQVEKQGDAPAPFDIRSRGDRRVGSQFEPELPSLNSQTFPQSAHIPNAHAAQSATPAIRSGTALEFDKGVFTRLGGILYLVHLVRQMELVRRFDTGLSAWALTELIARCLLGSIPSTSHLLSDPIWTALAELEERDPRVAAGQGFQPQPKYASPDSWLAGLEPATPLIRYRERGFELWRPEGFIILDSETPDTPDRILRRRPRQLRRASGIVPAGLSPPPELRRFLHFVMPYVRRRLSQLLPVVTIGEVFQRQGKLVLSSSHVDLVMGMSQISVPVRLAGLDANPGWVPDFGRVVSFYFLPEGPHA